MTIRVCSADAGFKDVERAQVFMAYRGYSISYSSVFSPKEIAVFEGEVPDSRDPVQHFYGSAQGLRDAFAYVDAQHAANETE